MCGYRQAQYFMVFLYKFYPRFSIFDNVILLLFNEQIAFKSVAVYNIYHKILVTSNTKKICLFIIIIVSIWGQTNVYVSPISSQYGDKDSITTSIVFYSIRILISRLVSSTQNLGSSFLVSVRSAM